MENFWNKPFVRLVAGQFAAASLLVGLPLALVLGVFVWPWATAAFLALLLMQVGIHASQISARGTWIPQKWAAVAFVPIPLAYLAVSLALFFDSSVWLGLAASIAALNAGADDIRVVKSWLSPTDRAGETVPMRHHEAHSASGFEDEPMTMVF